MKDVLITMDTCYDGQDSETQTVKGVRHDRDGKIYLRFEQSLSDGGRPVATLLTIDGQVVRVHRKGDSGGDFVFDVNSRRDVDYRTPMGILPMEIETGCLNVFITEDTLKIELKYNILSDGQVMTAVIMTIQARP